MRAKIAGLAFPLVLGGGCASLSPSSLFTEKSQIPAGTADGLMTAIQAHREPEALEIIDSLQTRLHPPLSSKDQETLNRVLASAADQGAACPQRLVGRLVAVGATTTEKNLKMKITRWLTCPDLLASIYRMARPEQAAPFATIILDAIPKQVEAGSLVLRRAIIMENRDLGGKILEVTREQLEEYGWVFRMVLADSEARCARHDREFCTLKGEALKMRGWFESEAERKRGLVIQGQLDAKAQAAFLEIVNTIYGPLLQSPDTLDSKHVPLVPDL